MPNLGFPEILMIMVIALMVFGPRKLPELGQSLGRALREFRQHTRLVTDEFQRDLEPRASATSVVVPPMNTPVAPPVAVTPTQPE